MEPIQTATVATKPRQTMLPLLVILFLISYVLLTTLVVLQDRTIDSQRGLIHLLFKDNLHLVASKMALHKSGRSIQVTAAGASSSNPSAQVELKKAPSSQVPLVPAPSTQVPVIQAKPEASAKSGQKSRKTRKASPLRPPAEITDPSDMRRVSISI